MIIKLFDIYYCRTTNDRNAVQADLNGFPRDAIFFNCILGKVGQITMGFGKLELKRESALGQKRTLTPNLLMSAFGCKADIKKTGIMASIADPK